MLAAASGGAPVAGAAVPAVVAIPTTFSGSEMTPLYGVTAGGQKKTGRDARVMPRTVIYDPLLLANLPPAVAGPSGMNAIAHCAEALYAEDANPITSLMAEEGMRALAASLPRVVGVGSGPIGVDVRGEARAEALYGAWLAGNCLGAVGMALHHKLCHTLGGSFNLPHAETHTIVLPHALRYNREAAPEAMSRMSRALTAAGPGAADPAARLHDLARALGAPLGLAADRPARGSAGPGGGPGAAQPVLQPASARAGSDPPVAARRVGGAAAVSRMSGVSTAAPRPPTPSPVCGRGWGEGRPCERDGEIAAEGDEGGQE